MSGLLRLALVIGITGAGLRAQVVPDVLYYRFNEGAGATTANAAIPGAGNPAATLNGAIGFGTGLFGSGLAGTGQTGANQSVATGYTLNLQGQSWTLEFWLNPNATTASLQYLFGVPTGGSFRCFMAAVPGNGNLTLTGSGLTNTIAAGAATTPGVWAHVAYVFDASTAPPTITPYVNAVPGAPVNQTGSPNLSTGLLSIGSQITGSAGLNGVIDEFRLWLSARTPAQIFASYNTELYPNNILTATTTGGGTGDLFLSLTAISPGATEGYVLLSADTSLPPGTGFVFGIMPDALTWNGVLVPIAPGNPLHFPLGFFGLFPEQPFQVPPGALSALAGTTWDFVAVLFGPSFTYMGASNVQRVAW